MQGVGFRHFVRQTANGLGVAGWVRNLDDGRVEVYATGPAERLSDLAAALHGGPRLADVRSVEEREEKIEKLSAFTVR